MNDTIKRLNELLINKGIASPKNIVGCSESEINELELYFNVRLPLVYKDFLREMGHQAGEYQAGTDIYYKSLFKLRRQFEGILRDNADPFLLKTAIFVFSGHQGVIFHFFDTEEDSVDPPIYGYLDGEEKMKLVYKSYSDYLSDDLN